jgi:uncharacterized membrane protein YkvA (DUF1232 family)
MLDALKARAKSLRTETYSLHLAARDPRTPWTARALVLLIVGYALSPIDLVPDFIPVLGYLDDLIIIPAGIALAVRLIPAEVMTDARRKARLEPPGSLGAAGAVIIVLIWILAIILVFGLLHPLFKVKS